MSLVRSRFMAWRFSFLSNTRTLNPNHNCAAPFSTSFLVTKTPKKLKKKRKAKGSPRTNPVQSEPNRIPSLERIVQRDALLRFVIRSKQYLSSQTEHVLRLDDAGKLHRELGFPRGRKVSRFLHRHPLLFQTYRHTDGKTWMGFTDLMEDLLAEEHSLMDSLELDRVHKVRKLLMMSARHRIPLSKIHHCRTLFGIPDDFRDRVSKYPNYFKIVVDHDGKRVLELVNWDPLLAVSALEKEFVVDEDSAKKKFRFPLKYGKDLDLESKDNRRLDLLNSLPLVSPYSKGNNFDVWTLEAEKYRVGLIHEFLSLTLEKRASIHHLVEFKDEFSLTKHTYQMLQKQPRAFYLAGTEMNWVVFLKDAYDGNGVLIHKDPQLLFNDKLYKYAQLDQMEPEPLQD
ncbi:hypothetical protein VNO78_01351 [Psophocarpus tetragonolobus]|uniref:PORR domain-containing protein n=1 Tax=Psophocarpus tetragonolobus TaxID=3891 RepID=A0AAN9SXX0_PSOTE